MERGKVLYALHKVNRKNMLEVIIDYSPNSPRRSAMLNSYTVICERPALYDEMNKMQTRRFQRWGYKLNKLNGLLEDEIRILGEEKANNIYNQIISWLCLNNK